MPKGTERILFVDDEKAAVDAICNLEKLPANGCYKSKASLSPKIVAITNHYLRERCFCVDDSNASVVLSAIDHNPTQTFDKRIGL